MRKTKTLKLLQEMDASLYEAERFESIYEAKKRVVKGVSEHGELSLDTDKREWVQETLEEVYDAINYLLFLSIKLRKIQNGISNKV